MRRHWQFFSLVFAIIFLLAAKSEATSLFQSNGSLANMFSDYKARQVGDTVTIVVSETSISSQKAATSSTKKTDLAAGEVKIGSNDNPITKFLKKVLPFSHSDSSKFAGDGSTSRSSNLRAQMTAVVTEVLPNGNMMIEGKQKITVNAETQEIIVKGMIRPVDINYDNIVYSQSIANAEIQYKGKGAVGDTQKPGILTRLFNWVF